MDPPAVEFIHARFSRDWVRHPSARHAEEAVRGYRIVGVVSVRVDGTEREGLLLRHTQTRGFRLVGDFPAITLPVEATRRFLESLRAGFHGGPGRCQGRNSVDGCYYLRRCKVSLGVGAADTLSRMGEGNVSLGTRRLADNARTRMVERFGRVGALYDLDDHYQPIPGRALVFPLHGVTVRVTEEQVALLREIGGGEVTAGIRAGLWLLQHRHDAYPRGIEGN